MNRLIQFRERRPLDPHEYLIFVNFFIGAISIVTDQQIWNEALDFADDYVRMDREKKRKRVKGTY